MNEMERELCVGAVLDVTQAEWIAAVRGLEADVLDALSPALQARLGSLIAGLDGGAAFQGYLQTLAMCEDDGLADVLDFIQRNPLVLR
jgi:hypothetical protein